jgi:hypothetical protein
VLSARQFIGAATTALSLITGAFPLALAAGNARAQGSAISVQMITRLFAAPNKNYPVAGDGFSCELKVYAVHLLGLGFWRFFGANCASRFFYSLSG